jgi:hypothetical protein
MTATPATESARAELDRVLALAGWSYYKAAIRYDWQLGWNSRRQPMPPPVEMLSEEQVFHLMTLVRVNQLKTPR